MNENWHKNCSNYYLLHVVAFFYLCIFNFQKLLFSHNSYLKQVVTFVIYITLLVWKDASRNYLVLTRKLICKPLDGRGITFHLYWKGYRFKSWNSLSSHHFAPRRKEMSQMPSHAQMHVGVDRMGISSKHFA